MGRITPACAGTTKSKSDCIKVRQDHPRMCGDYSPCSIDLCVGWGSPLHVRGLLLIKNFLDYTIGITPTCAGTTWYQVQGLPLLWDHPCMCGDYPGNATYKICSRGSPLHVRGLPCTLLIPASKLGITPACAGTTRKSKSFSPTC